MERCTELSGEAGSGKGRDSQQMPADNRQSLDKTEEEAVGQLGLAFGTCSGALEKTEKACFLSARGREARSNSVVLVLDLWGDRSIDGVNLVPLLEKAVYLAKTLRYSNPGGGSFYPRTFELSFF